VTVPIKYLGHELHLRLPPIALTASLAYFARLFPLTHPPYREQGEVVGPTVEDIDDYNLAFRPRTVPRGPGFPDNNLIGGGVSLTPSACHDWDWLRSVAEDLSGSVGRYTPGTLTGKWRGTVLVRLLRVLVLHAALRLLLMAVAPCLRHHTTVILRPS
jgi:hypothetical protein